MIQLGLIGLLGLFAFTPVMLAGERFFIDTEKSVIIDQQTGLMWPLKDNGSDISWPAAHEYCDQFNQGGFDDWRMPTQDELATLYRLEAAQTTEYYIIEKISITACCLWAKDNRSSKVASFDFEYGNRDWGHAQSTVDARVLPVRYLK
ncbi:MAG: DUF1566 domain-containing protein [Thermodesulfobacteriota bacterium]